MHLISTQGGERATQGAGGKLVTRDGKTHVVWQDSVAPALPTPGNVPRSDGYLNQVRTYDHATGAWSPVVTLNKGIDNHARPNLCMDHQGFLHVVISGHGTPVTYRRSLRPDDSAAWAELWRTGVQLGCTPYYMFVERDTGAQHYFGVPLARAHAVFRDATAAVSGRCATSWCSPPGCWLPAGRRPGRRPG